MRVLVIEDEIKMAGLLRRGLAEEGLSVDVARSGEDALIRARATDYDEIELSAKEFALLETFMRQPGRVLSRFQLLEHAWNYSYESRSNVVDVYVRYLREKLDRPFGVESIETVRGAGYRLREDGGCG